MRVLEGLVIAVTVTQLIYLAVIHAGLNRSRYGPGDPMDPNVPKDRGAAH